jgi:hypothetical protein
VLYEETPPAGPSGGIPLDVYLLEENGQLVSSTPGYADVRLYTYSPSDISLAPGSETPAGRTFSDLVVILRSSGPPGGPAPTTWLGNALLAGIGTLIAVGDLIAGAIALVMVHPPLVTSGSLYPGRQQRTGGRAEPRQVKPTVEKEPEAIGLIYGVVPDSKNEWWIALALWRLGWEFEYQVPLLGGSSAGGTMVDFVIPTYPRKTPLYYDGSHWHPPGGSDRDRWVRERLMQRYRRELNPVVVLYGEDVSNVETAFASVEKAIGRA